MNIETFKAVLIQVIDQLEGGYYHPDMLADGRVKDARYGNSGETMFGLDRKAGGNLNTTPAGVKFWAEIDKLNARKNWKWNYKGGDVAPRLKEQLADVMFPHYTDLSNRYLSDKAAQIVESDNRLLFHFIYAAWNGAGWFKKFATKINDAVANGTTNADKLVKIALDSRINSGNSLIAQGGNKIAKFFGTNPTFSYTASRKSNTKRIVIVVIVIVAVGLLIYYRKPILSIIKNVF